MNKTALYNEKVETFYFKVSIFFYICNIIGLALITCSCGLLLLVCAVVCLKENFTNNENFENGNEKLKIHGAINFEVLKKTKNFFLKENVLSLISPKQPNKNTSLLDTKTPLSYGTHEGFSRQMMTVTDLRVFCLKE